MNKLKLLKLLISNCLRSKMWEWLYMDTLHNRVKHLEDRFKEMDAQNEDSK